MEEKPIVILDICCGAGSISLCCMKRMEKAQKAEIFHASYGCLGVEILKEAIEDAKLNASINGFKAKRYL